MGKIEKSGYDMLICLGDIAGFGVPHYKYLTTRSAHDCLSLLREKHALVIPGNHDYHSARIIPKISPGFDFPPDWYELDFRQQAELGKDKVWLHEADNLNALFTHEDTEYLRSLAEYQVLDAGNLNIMLSHYVYPNLSGFLRGFFSSGGEFKAHFEFMEKLHCKIGFTGHTHFRGVYTVSQGVFKQYGYKKLRLKEIPLCAGFPPVTSSNNRSGFCIFDTESSLLRVIRS